MENPGPSARGVPPKGIDKEYKDFFVIFSVKIRVLEGFCVFPGVLEGLGSSGRLVGTISTYPGTD